MPINRKLAIQILNYLYKNPNFNFPFVVVCREYNSEDDDFVEICPEERRDIEDDEVYQTFQLWETWNRLDKDYVEYIAKWYIWKIIFDNLTEETKENIKQLEELFENEPSENIKMWEYWDNEYFKWKKEALEETLRIIESYRFDFSETFIKKPEEKKRNEKQFIFVTKDWFTEDGSWNEIDNLQVLWTEYWYNQEIAFENFMKNNDFKWIDFNDVNCYEYQENSKKDFSIKDYIPSNFPKVLIIRIYEDDWIEITFTNDNNEENIKSIYRKLDKESKSKHFNKYVVCENWYWIEIEK